MNAKLKKDIGSFLSLYRSFEQKPSKYGHIILEGKLSIVDDKKKYWDSYKIIICVPELQYPHVETLVFEKSTKIKRKVDNHISKEGACCLDIPHKLIKMARRGICLTTFYQEVIYPYFANHQHYLSAGKYANGEYEHFDKGIIQFYREEYGLEDYSIVIKCLELAIGKTKTLRNATCPICGKKKYKKCCSSIVNKLKPYTQERLIEDLAVFKRALN